jgi:hypothetical protein
MARIGAELKCLISYFVFKDYLYPHQFTRAAAEIFILQLPQFLNNSDAQSLEKHESPHPLFEDDVLANEGDDVGSLKDEEDEEGLIGESRYVVALTALERLWHQRKAMQKLGIAPLPEHPFGGRGVIAVARELATKARGWVMPLPDEISIPLLNGAASLLNEPAEDVCRLLEIISDREAGTTYRVNNGRGGLRDQVAGRGDVARRTRIRKALEDFEFTELPASGAVWHPALACDSKAVYFEIKRLWTAVRTAACIVVETITGMRPSELLGLKAGVDPTTGLPAAVRVEVSPNGLHETFVLHAPLSKSQKGFIKDMDWVVGTRARGDITLPLGIHALLLLNRLYAPWRPTAASDRLILSMDTRGSLPKPTTALLAMQGKRLTSSMKNFVADWIDLSKLPDSSRSMPGSDNLLEWKETNGRLINAAMLRKTWANFVLACDPRLLPVIQLQFHHLSSITTESGYIGNNPLLLETLDSVAVQKRNQMMLHMIEGKTPFIGKISERFKIEMHKLRQTMQPLPESDRWKNTTEWCAREQIPVFFSSHSNCMPLETNRMRCHKSSKTPVWLRLNPDFSNREPSLCAGCDCSIMDLSHEAFWIDRYIEYSVSAAQVTELQLISPGVERELSFRANQARIVLKRFGTNLVAVQEVVDSKKVAT